MSHAVVDASNCTNCRATLHGRFCAACGQKVMPLDPTVGHFLHDLGHEVLHLDGKIFRSVWLLLTRPGLLTQELLAGRRASYVSPIRLYLTFSIAAFAVLALIPRQPAVQNVDPSRPPGIAVERSRRGITINGENLRPEQLRQLNEATAHLIPRMMFVLLPVCALLVKVVTRRTRRHYPYYLYFALHIHAAYFAALALSAPIAFLFPVARSAISGARLLYILAYSAMALRRVFGVSRSGATWRTAAVFVTYMTFVGVGLLGAFTAAAYSTGLLGPQTAAPAPATGTAR